MSNSGSGDGRTRTPPWSCRSQPSRSPHIRPLDHPSQRRLELSQELVTTGEPSHPCRNCPPDADTASRCINSGCRGPQQLGQRLQHRGLQLPGRTDAVVTPLSIRRRRNASCRAPYSSPESSLPAPRCPPPAGTPTVGCPPRPRPRTPTPCRTPRVGPAPATRTGNRRSAQTRPRPTASRHTCAGFSSRAAKYAMSVTASPARATADSAAATNDRAAGTAATPTYATRTPAAAAEVTGHDPQHPSTHAPRDANSPVDFKGCGMHPGGGPRLQRSRGVVRRRWRRSPGTRRGAGTDHNQRTSTNRSSIVDVMAPVMAPSPRLRQPTGRCPTAASL